MTHKPQNIDSREVDLAKMQLGIYIDLYKHHFDLFLKASVIYLGVVTGLAVASFRADELTIRCSLSIMVSMAAIVGFVAGKLYKDWLASIETTLSHLSDRLGVVPIVFTQTKI